MIEMGGIFNSLWFFHVHNFIERGMEEYVSYIKCYKYQEWFRAIMRRTKIVRSLATGLKVSV